MEAAESAESAGVLGHAGFGLVVAAAAVAAVRAGDSAVVEDIAAAEPFVGVSVAGKHGIAGQPRVIGESLGHFAVSEAILVYSTQAY